MSLIERERERERERWEGKGREGKKRQGCLVLVEMEKTSVGVCMLVSQRNIVRKQ